MHLTGIIPFSILGKAQRIGGSTLLRVDGLTQCAPDFQKWQHGRQYDSLIFQKAYWVEMMKLFSGPKILDLCDPDWLNDTIDIVEISSHVHAITCSSDSLTTAVKKILPQKLVYHVPDRLNSNFYPPPRKSHSGVTKNLVWFGFVHNAHETLAQLAPAIEQLNLRLKIISDLPYSQDDAILRLNPEFVQYDQATIYELLKETDIVLNPRSTRAYYKYKSNNKSIISWKLGLPVAETQEQIFEFMNPESRNAEVAVRQSVVEEHYNILRSAEEYREILSTIRYKFF